MQRLVADDTHTAVRSDAAGTIFARGSTTGRSSTLTVAAAAPANTILRDT
jgi:hypothetical protein